MDRYAAGPESKELSTFQEMLAKLPGPLKENHVGPGLGGEAFINGIEGRKSRILLPELGGAGAGGCGR